MTGSSPAFLDTSFIIRYLTNDLPELAERVARTIEGDKVLILSEMALLESAYVLASRYHVPRAEIVDSLMALVQRRNLRMASVPKARVLEALHLCRDSKRYSLTDALLWAQALENDAAGIYTFDRRFPRSGLPILTGE